MLVSTLLLLSFIIIGSLLLYHLFYAQLLGYLKPTQSKPTENPRPGHFPFFTIILPIFNEQAVIQRKIENLAQLHYPLDKLEILLVCDGCTDETITIIHQTLQKLTARQRCFKLIENPENQGKVVCLNQAMKMAKGELICFTDASALLEKGALETASIFFNTNPSLGIVSAQYTLNNPGSMGEKKYWDYQTKIKTQESHLGVCLGAHGAGYFIRRELYKPLPAEVINDDFIIPMQVQAQGYTGLYTENICAHEIECAAISQDFSRRRRIAAGNFQQIKLLKKLLMPSRGQLGFLFFSSKVLRTFFPFGLTLLWSINLLLCFYSSIFIFPFLAQTLFYILGCFPRFGLVHYFCYGQLASLLGVFDFLRGKYQRGWKNSANSDTFRIHVHPLVHLGKACFDKLAAIVGLFVTLLFFPFIALAIKLDSKGPIFYKQLRVGKMQHDKTHLFYIVKFRTMRTEKNNQNLRGWTQKNDSRITRVGKFLRKTRLDELPQFYNILCGHMSLIGPRPERPIFIQHLDTHIPFYTERFVDIVPGVTGFAQVNTGYDETIEDVRRKVSFDHAYAMALSKPLTWIVTDILILLKTIKVVLLGQGQ